MNSFFKKIKILINMMFLSKNEKIFIKKNELTFNQPKKDNKNIILIDLFDWYPWIHLWSFLVNELSKKQGYEVHFFYFRLYEGFFSKFRIHIYKLKKIYRSFGVYKGISEYELSKEKTNIDYFEKKFDKLKTKRSLYNYKYKNIRIGDLIYSQYLRAYLKPTINISDKKLKAIFIRAHIIYDAIDDYFKKFNVKYIIPSHLCYVSFGLISRIANQKYKTPIIKIFSKNRGKNLFRFIKIDKYLLDENPYYKFKKIFLSLPNHKKKNGFKIGKRIMLQRLTSEYDPNIPYMKKNQFNKVNIKNINNTTKKKNIFLFAHCYFDNPMRYRNMLFTDFYEQVDFLLSKSKKNADYQWYYKPHPNELKNNIDYISQLKRKFPKVIFLDKKFSHNSVLKLNPHLIITNFGTVAHEFAYFKVPVINTGDNPHVNYNFSLTPKNKKELSKMIFNMSEFKSKINFNKKDIYEFLFLQYHFFASENNAKQLINDEKLFKDINKNNNDLIIKNINKNYKLNEKNLTIYTNNFLKNNLQLRS